MIASTQPQTPVVQPIQFVTDVEAWRQFWLAFGLAQTRVADPMWTVLATGSGRIALHHTEAEDPLAGATKLTLDVPDLDAYAEAVSAQGTPVRKVTLGHGDALEIDLPRGTLIVNRAEVTDGQASVAPEHLNVTGLVYGDAVAEGARIAATLGLTPRVASDSGGWTDLTGYGMVAFHEDKKDASRGTPLADGGASCEITFETGDVGALHQRLETAGLTARLIDESYARTLRVDMPDGQELWVNETIRDFYGFHHAGGGTSAGHILGPAPI